MGLRKLVRASAGWIRNTRRDVSEYGLDGAGRSLKHLAYGGSGRLLQLVGETVNYGENVFERDWDLLVVLDACRADLMADVWTEYEYIGEYDEIDSVASQSEEWYRKTFTDDHRAEIRETACVSANPFTAESIVDRPLALLDEVWRYAWDDELGTVPPRAVTDRAIETARDRDPDRLVAHYMQPHYPFVRTPLGDGLRRHDLKQTGRTDVWSGLRAGRIPREEAWNAYRENLELVLEEVRLLASSVEADEAVLTADHGNAFGEYGVYGHPSHVPIGVLKRVPWCRFDAEDTGEYEPGEYDVDRTSRGPGDRLEALGYR